MAHVLSVFAENEARSSLSTTELYKQLELNLDIEHEAFVHKQPVGKSGALHNLEQRKVRWHIQSLKALGMLKQMDRGSWGLTDKARSQLTHAPAKQVMVAFSTDLGVALWANAEDVMGRLGEQITLVLTSPPYPLARERQYGNVAEREYVDWLTTHIERILPNLRAGGSVVLNLSNDIFERGLPSRSLYLERLVLALNDRLGLSLMDRIVWENTSKAPGPIQWASLKRFQCNTGYEPVLWFTNDPSKVLADNRRVLLPHTPAHQALIDQGGEGRTSTFAGGAYRLRPGSFGAKTEGRIPRNVISMGHRDADQAAARAWAKEKGLPVHPAMMPLRLAEFFVKFLSAPDDLVCDPFGGAATTAKAAEVHKRRWLITERCREYIAAAAERFRDAKGFEACPA